MTEAGDGGIWVYAERRGKSFTPVSLELLGKARELANRLRVPMTAVTAGADRGPASELRRYGPDLVLELVHPLLANHDARAYTTAIAAELEKARPSILLLGATRNGQDLAGRLAVRLRTGLTAHVTSLELNGEHLLVGWVPGFGGGIEAGITCPVQRPQMVTVRPGVFPLPPSESPWGDVETVKPVLTEKDVGSRRLSFEPKGSTVDLTKADVIVVGGRGTQGEFRRVERLAYLLGGEVGATRVAADAGWVDRDRMIGQTGVITRPKLAIVLGVSGAVQFTVGIEGAGTVIAVNRDPDAPIFDHADLGIVGELGPVVDSLIHALEEG
ncbi:MAG TPA: electron transfer flavoprotein subunit alpha/FixB family protein [Thermoplasmata archaeon]|nr:electron transfer flavoprotein subunit alpha/FixB family protein [Thermoplasmata archaeon]